MEDRTNFLLKDGVMSAPNPSLLKKRGAIVIRTKQLLPLSNFVREGELKGVSER